MARLQLRLVVEYVPRPILTANAAAEKRNVPVVLLHAGRAGAEKGRGEPWKLLQNAPNAVLPSGSPPSVSEGGDTIGRGGADTACPGASAPEKELTHAYRRGQ